MGIENTYVVRDVEHTEKVGHDTVTVTITVGVCTNCGEQALDTRCRPAANKLKAGAVSDVDIESTGSFTNPGHTTDNFALVFISKYDQCNNVQLELGANFDPIHGQADFTGTIQYGNDLTSAAMTGTAPLYDVNTGDLLFTANIDVTWQRNGAMTHNSDNEHFHSPTIIVNTNIHGTSRPQWHQAHSPTRPERTPPLRQRPMLLCSTPMAARSLSPNPSLC